MGAGLDDGEWGSEEEQPDDEATLDEEDAHNAAAGCNSAVRPWRLSGVLVKLPRLHVPVGSAFCSFIRATRHIPCKHAVHCRHGICVRRMLRLRRPSMRRLSLG